MAEIWGPQKVKTAVWQRKLTIKNFGRLQYFAHLQDKEYRKGENVML